MKDLKVVVVVEDVNEQNTKQDIYWEGRELSQNIIKAIAENKDEFIFHTAVKNKTNHISRPKHQCIIKHIDQSMLFVDKDAKNYTTEQLQQQMSYIEQDVFLFNTTIRENITLGEDFTEAQLQKALHDSALIGDLSSMPDGLNTIVGEEGRNLSGGQKQRVAIARALIHNRSILLVDEGTSALDQKNAEIVENSLLQAPNLTLILISHHLTEERKRQFDAVYELKPVTSSVQSD